MDLWQLHIFCKVVEQRSFSKAGKLVHLTQPTVSSHIKELETHFGCRLIDRLAKEAVPTREGQLLYEYALKLIALRDETETAISHFAKRISGNLAIGGSTIPGGYILPTVIGNFLQRHPDVYPSMKVADTAEIARCILAGELEIGVVGARLPDRQIRQQKLLEDEMRLILPPGHRLCGSPHITAQMLIGKPFILRETGSGTLKSVNESLKDMGLRIEDLHIVAELGSTEAVIGGVKSGIGLSIVSAIAISEELQAGTLKSLPIHGMNMKRSFYLTHHKYRSLSPPAQAFALYIEEALSP